MHVAVNVLLITIVIALAVLAVRSSLRSYGRSRDSLRRTRERMERKGE